jgi:glycerate 2-kinase
VRQFGAMRVVVAPDKLRGTYTAADAAAALAHGWHAVRDDDVVEVPLADGGEGTAAALMRARGGEWREADVHDALGRPCVARFARLIDGSGALDVAEACGPLRVRDVARDPLGASSRGAGELVRAAIEDGAMRIVIGVGGTASTDGGAGLRDGLGDVPGDVELVAALDVQNPLLGPDGAAAAFGPQKGATPDQVAELEERLRRLGLSTADRPGAGAGGGIGAMLMALGAHAIPGAALVAAEAALEPALEGAEVCVTAEGRIDRQTLSGKVVAEVADICRRAGVQCIAVGGIVEPVAAEELRRRGCDTYQQGDLELAGRELASRWSPLR